jgi:hypothetical protein
LNIDLTLYTGIHHSLSESIDRATAADVQKYIRELAAYDYGLLVLDSKSNNHHLFVVPWKSKWHISYSGLTEDFFGNGRLIDKQVTQPEKIEFFDGQWVYCLTDELIYSATTTAVASHFIEYTRLLTPENHEWRWRDMLPL